jgi:hypothetical protein
VGDVYISFFNLILASTVAKPNLEVGKPGLPDFSWYKIPKPEIMYLINTNVQMGIKFPNAHR